MKHFAGLPSLVVARAPTGAQNLPKPRPAWPLPLELEEPPEEKLLESSSLLGGVGSGYSLVCRSWGHAVPGSVIFK